MPLPLQPTPSSELDDWDYNPAGQHETVMVSFPRALQVPGLQHIVHNAATDMMSAAPMLKGQVAMPAGIAKMIHRKYYRKRLVSMCYSSPVCQLLIKT